MRDFALFVLLDGLLLFGLFYSVTFVLAFAQQGSDLQGLIQRLQRARLVSGSIYAALIGAVTPFCSCSTIPMFSAMIRTRMRFGVAMTFLMSSPLVDEATVIVMATYFGLVNTALFVLVASAFSVIAAILLDLLGFSRYVKARPEEEVAGEVKNAGSAVAAIPWRSKVLFAHVLAKNELRAVAGYIFVGLLIGGAIYGFIPQEWIIAVTRNVSTAALVPLMALIGAPMYLNAAAAVPVAFALTEKGLGLGPVMAFMVAGSGMAIPEMVLLSTMFRPQLMAAWFVSMLSIAVAIGYIFAALS